MTGAGEGQGSRFKEQGSRGKVSRAECSGIGECKIQGMGEFKKCVNSRNGRIQEMCKFKEWENSRNVEFKEWESSRCGEQGKGSGSCSVTVLQCHQCYRVAGIQCQCQRCYDVSVVPYIRPTVVPCLGGHQFAGNYQITLKTDS